LSAMDYDSLIEAVRSESGALTFALEAGAIDDLVPTCSGWEVRDLAIHIGNICEFWSHVLCDGTGRPKVAFADPPRDDELIGWVADACAALITELEVTPARTEVWTWSATDHTAGFVARRCAHELTVHRYDAQSSRGICTPIPAELAVDGIDEVLDVLVVARQLSGKGSGRVMDLRSSDAGLEWSVTLERERMAVDRRSQDEPPVDRSDLVVSGTASDLELTLYHRPTLSPVDVHGDYTVLEEWHREFTL
jgi:uncharacterized protein (TIGR03083 family)